MKTTGKKQRLQSDCERYESIVNGSTTTVLREDIYETMATSIKRWIVDNIEYAARAWFERVEQTVLRANHSLNQREFGFAINPDAIVALGDSQRIRLGYCTRDLCILRKKIIDDNRTHTIVAADKEIAALDDIISQLKDGQTIDDLMP